MWGVTPVGLRPPCMTPHIGNSKKQPADDPLIRRQSLCRQTRPPLRATLYTVLANVDSHLSCRAALILTVARQAKSSRGFLAVRRAVQVRAYADRIAVRLVEPPSCRWWAKGNVPKVRQRHRRVLVRGHPDQRRACSFATCRIVPAGTMLLEDWVQYRAGRRHRGRQDALGPKCDWCDYRQRGVRQIGRAHV